MDHPREGDESGLGLRDRGDPDLHLGEERQALEVLDAGRVRVPVGDEQVDLHPAGRGGPAFVYFLKITRSSPYFTLTLDTDKTLVAPGIASVIYARVTRKEGFTGGVQLAVTM